MRTRRLRRLGLLGADTMAAPSADETTTQVPLATTALDTNTPQVSKKPSPEPENNQHKQKQQKIDNDSTNLEPTFNNNIAHSSSDVESKISTNSLTQRSRLLDMFTSPIDNNSNQNIKVADDYDAVIMTPVKADIPMDVAESPIKTARSINVESMDIDELSPPTEITKTVVAAVEPLLTDEQKNHEAEICISRILDVIWMESCEGQVIPSKELCDFYQEVIINGANPIHFDDWTSQIISDVVAQYFDGRQIDFKATRSNESNTASMTTGLTLTLASEGERMETNEPSCSTPSMMPHNLPAQGVLTYLTQSYFRCWRESDRYRTPKNLQKFGNHVLDVLAIVRKEIVLSAKLLLDGTITPLDNEAHTHKSVLLKLMYEEAVPSDFLCLLVEETYQDPKSFRKIFGTLVQNLYNDMQSRIACKTIDMSTINILRQLTEITVPGNIRPISNLIVNLPNFAPNLVSAIPGREIVKVSFLGPFLSLSVFSEENTKMAEDVDENWENTFGKSLQMVCWFSS